MALVELTQIRKTVAMPGESGSVDVLIAVDLAVERGDQIAIQGRSGSGKSTLLAIVGLLDAASSGRLVIGGREMSSASSRERDRLRAQMFGFVFQRFCLLDHLSAVENVELALSAGEARLPDRRTAAVNALQTVGLGDRRHHRPRELSGGEQQRVALARAIVGGAPVLLADEPTGSLDGATGSDVMRRIRTAADLDSRTLIIVTHDATLASGFDRTYVLDRGQLVEEILC